MTEYDIDDLRERLQSARGCGVVHAALAGDGLKPSAMEAGAKADSLVATLGYRAPNHGWRELTRAGAAEWLRALLQRDLAYGAEAMAPSTAAGLVEEFLNLFPDAATFLTNAELPVEGARGQRLALGAWEPLTAATYDSGVVAVSGRLVGLVWVQDED